MLLCIFYAACHLVACQLNAINLSNQHITIKMKKYHQTYIQPLHHCDWLLHQDTKSYQPHISKSNKSKIIWLKSILYFWRCSSYISFCHLGGDHMTPQWFVQQNHIILYLAENLSDYIIFSLFILSFQWQVSIISMTSICAESVIYEPITHPKNETFKICLWLNGPKILHNDPQSWATNQALKSPLQ